MKFQKYTKYKASGVDWLGEIPEEWEVKRLKDIFSEFGSGSTPKAGNPYYYENAKINWLNTSDLNNSEINVIKYKVTNLAVKDYSLKIFKENSLAMAMYGQGKTRGMVGLIKVKTTTNQASCIMQNIKNINNIYYILWLLISEYNYIRSINTGTTQPNMNQDFIRNITIFAPPKQTQTKIANYLDEKTNLIDKKISLLQKKKEKYKELKQTLINEVVTKGLDNNVKMKESEIKWIGEIPEHWEVKRGKDISMYIKRINKKLDCKNVLSLTYKGVINKDFYTTAGLNPENYNTYQFVDKNDLIFKLIDLDNIKTSRVGLVHEYGIMSSAYIRLKPLPENYSKYFYYLYFYYYKINLFNYLGGGVRSTLNFSKLLEIFVITPPKQEQIQIANYLDEKTKKIDDIMEKINENIATLKEFRKTLINDAVTGKIKVA